MKSNRQQKLVMGLFCLALLGLAYDRIFLLPQGAEADPSEDAKAQRTGLLLAVGTIPEDSTTGTELKNRINEHLPAETLDLSQVRDAFVPLADWLGASDPNGPSQTVEHLEFKQKFRLQAIMFQSEMKAVFMNDEIIHIGDRVEGYQLVDLTATSATFELDGIRTVLLLD